MFEKSKWIARKDSNKVEPAPLFRKSFEIKSDVKSATLYICGLGYACNYINGKSVADEVFTTPYTKFDTRVHYNTYDITNLLTEGKNTFGCVLGNGCYFVNYWRWDYYKPHWMHHPKLIAQIDIEYKNGQKQTINSDTSWKTYDSAIIFNQPKQGEIFDARLYDKNWNLPFYDDSSWDNAFICRSPGGILEERNTPPIRVTKRLKGKYIGNNVYDIGENISGWARIKARGERGTEISMKYAELLHEDGTLAPEQLNTIIGSDTHFDTYIMSGDGEENWAPSFAYHGFRYVEVTGAPEEFELIGEMIHTDFDVIGEFTTDNEMINKIHDICIRATLSNYVGVPTDCTQREQNAWTGDALCSLDQIMMNFDAYSSLKKWLVDIRDTQRPSGQICCMAPGGGWGYNWGSGPAWDSLLIQAPYYMYSYTGDKSVIEQMWDSMALYMQFMESMSDNDLVCFGLGDWCPPENIDVCPTEITDAGYYYIDNKIMARCAEIIGKDPSFYQERAKAIKTAFRKKFLDKDLFLNNNTTAISCAIYQDLYTDEEKPLAAKHLSECIAKKGYHIDSGILGMKYIFTALSTYGYADTLYKMVTNPEYPSYAYWINHGMTTLCETWSMKNSCNHHMYSEVDMWFYKHIAGIQLDEGAKNVTINPCFVEGISNVKAKHRDIFVEWNNEFVSVKSNIDGKIILNGKETPFTAGEHTFKR